MSAYTSRPKYVVAIEQSLYQEHRNILAVELILVCTSFRRTFRALLGGSGETGMYHTSNFSTLRMIAGGSQTHVGAEVAKGHRRHPLHRVIFRPDERHEDVESPFLQDRIAVLQVRRKVTEGPRRFSRNQGRRRSERLFNRFRSIKGVEV